MGESRLRDALATGKDAADLRKQLKDVEDRLAKNSKESDELRELRAKLRAEIEIKLRFEKDVKRSEKETDIQRKRADDLQRELDELRRRIKDLERDLVDAKKSGGDVA